ncbi:MAG: CHAT domain-containing protein [Alphaproteobacteria bacterium]
MKHAVTLAGIAVIASVGGAFAAPAPVQKAAGENLAREACHATGPAVPGTPQDIKCGKSDEIVGRLRVATLGQPLPADATARREAIIRNVKAMPGGLTANEQVTCDPAQWVGDTAFLICTLNANSWPRIVVTAASDRTLYKAEGIPSLLPVLHAAVANAMGRTASRADTEAGVRMLEAKLPRDVIRSGGADFTSYTHFVELGRLYGGANNFAGAETAYRQALEIELRLFGDRSVIVGETLAELALQVSNQGRFQEASELFNRATPLIEGSASAPARARLASYRALEAANQRRFADALNFARQATLQRRAEIAAQGGEESADPGAAAAGVSRGELAHSLRIEAGMALRLDDTAGARAAAEEALWIVSQEPGLPLWWRPEILQLMGEINEREGRVVSAERSFKDALELDRKLFGDTAPTALAAIKLGRFYSGQRLWDASVTAYREAFTVLSKDRIARSQVVPDQIVPFIAAAEGLAKNDPAKRATLDAEAFRAIQLANSDVADQTIARAAARQAADDPQLAALIREAQDAARARDLARIELAAQFAKPQDERDAGRERKRSEDLKAASARADAMQARVLQAYPDYARLAEPGPAELSTLQTQLRRDEAFIAYVIGYKGGYALLATRDELKTYKLDVTAAKLAEDVAALRRAFTPRLGSLSDFSLKSSASLYRQLVGPLEPELAGVQHLIVASTGDLASLPMVLLVSDGGSPSYSDAAWLVRRMALSQVPSPRAFVSLRDARLTEARAPRPFLGLGNPAFTGARTAKGDPLNALAGACRESGPMSADVLRALPPLRDTAREVRSVSSQLGGGTVLLGAEATEANLRAQQLDQYAVLYFATHGLLPGELRCQSEPGLVLSPPSRTAGSTSADGLLEAGEIASLKLNADLVVLSACNTAASGGSSFGGGALEGLSESFFNAGARSVLASHWEVPTLSTNRLMTGMFDRYGRDRGRGLSEALRQSQLSLISDARTAHPFHWAAFTVIGDGGGGAPQSAQEALKGGRS